MVWERGCGAHCGDWNRGKTAAAVATTASKNGSLAAPQARIFGEKLEEIGGLIWT